MKPTRKERFVESVYALAPEEPSGHNACRGYSNPDADYDSVGWFAVTQNVTHDVDGPIVETLANEGFDLKVKIMVPRGGLRQFNQFNDLAKSGTVKPSI